MQLADIKNISVIGAGTMGRGLVLLMPGAVIR